MTKRDEIEARVLEVEADHPPFTEERGDAMLAMRTHAPADLRYLLDELERMTRLYEAAALEASNLKLELAEMTARARRQIECEGCGCILGPPYLCSDCETPEFNSFDEAP